MSKYYEEQNATDYWDKTEENDAKPQLTKYDLDILTIDEDHNATIYMYNKLKEYIDNRNFIFPIIDEINSTNFTLWFSEHLENDLINQ